MTYYRHKHKERQMVIAMNGPMQNTVPLRDTFASSARSRRRPTARS
jgi:hypothetical protein